MAAESRDKDYVHSFVAMLEKHGHFVDFEAFNFYAWESMSYDRAETLQLIEPKLSGELSLVVCQLGENIQSAEGLKADYKELISFIKSHAQSARIIVISPFWPMPEVAEEIKQAAKESRVAYVDLSPLWGRHEFMCPADYEVEDEHGGKHVVNHSGVLRHPGSQGHAEIARRLLMAWEGKDAAKEDETLGLLQASYEEVKPEVMKQQVSYRHVVVDDIKKVISSLQDYKAQAIDARRFDTDIFLQQMEAAFETGGYRQKAWDKKTEILIINDSGIGDFINLSASIREIRRIYESARIVMISYSRAKALAESCPYVDELHLNERNFNWGDFMSAYDWNVMYVRRLLRHRFDIAFIFGHYASSYMLAYMSGARERISYGKDNPLCQGHPYAKFYPPLVNLLTVKLPDIRRSDSSVDGYLGILDNFLHVPVRNRHTEIWGLSGENEELNEIIEKIQGD